MFVLQLGAAIRYPSHFPLWPLGGRDQKTDSISSEIVKQQIADTYIYANIRWVLIQSLCHNMSDMSVVRFTPEKTGRPVGVGRTVIRERRVFVRRFSCRENQILREGTPKKKTKHTVILFCTGLPNPFWEKGCNRDPQAYISR